MYVLFEVEEPTSIRYLCTEALLGYIDLTTWTMDRAQGAFNGLPTRKQVAVLDVAIRDNTYSPNGTMILVICGYEARSTGREGEEAAIGGGVVDYECKEERERGREEG